jgi:hypothetical protein
MAGNVPIAQQPPMSSHRRNLCAVIDDLDVPNLVSSNVYVIGRLHDPLRTPEKLSLRGQRHRSHQEPDSRPALS